MDTAEIAAELVNAVDFLTAWPGERIHLTAIDPNTGKVIGHSFDKDDAGKKSVLECMRRAVKSGRGLYFNVNGLAVALNTRAKVKAAESEVNALHAFHVDVDVDKSITDPAAFEIAKADLLERIKSESPQPPSIIIDSGNGYGVFWLLYEPVAVTDANRDLFTRVNVALRDKLGGDAAQNLDRVMRVPFTVNFPNAAKRKRNRPVTPTRLVTDDRDFCLYTVDTFEPAPAEPKSDLNADAIDIPDDVDFDRLNPAFVDLLKNSADGGGKYGDGSRSAFVYAMACELRRARFTDGEIVWIITNPDFKISEHILDQKQREPVAQAMRVINRMNKDGVAAEPTAQEAFADDPVEPESDADQKFKERRQRERDRKKRKQEQRRERTMAGLVIVRGDAIDPENLDFIWKYVLARGVHTALAGEGGQGKSQLAYNIAATITNGGTFPDGSKAPQGNVVILSAEDNTKTMFGPRLIAAGANMQRIYKVQAVAAADGPDKKFSLQDDLEKLKRLCEEIGNVVLVIIDPASSYMGGTLDGRQNTQVRHVLDPLSKLAEDCDFAVLSITHFNKGTAAKAIHRVMDSAAFVTAPRAVFGIFPEQDNGIGESFFDNRRAFVKLKTNIGPDDMPGWRYRMELASGGTDRRTGLPVEATRIVWDGAASMTADQFVASENERSSPRADEAVAFLRRALADGPRLVDDVKAEAEAEGIAETTLQRAKRKLGIDATTDGPGKPWWWSLPSA